MVVDFIRFFTIPNNPNKKIVKSYIENNFRRNYFWRKTFGNTLVRLGG